MSKKRIIIIGAGLAGLSAAWHVQKNGVACKIFEKEAEVGGLCRSKKVKGFVFDCDGHLLHFRNKYTLNLIREELKVNIIRHQRSSWVYSFGRYIPYPFQANLRFLPPAIADECLKGFVKADRNVARKKYDNFLSWIKHSFGPGIAKHFMVPYNNKFWRFPLNKISCEWVDSFIPRPTLSQVLEDHCVKEQQKFGYNAHFWYPAKNSINLLPQAFEKQICGINKKCSIRAIDIDKKEFTIDGTTREHYDILISTIPLPELVKIISPVPKDILQKFSLLRWNSIFNLNLGVTEACHSGKHWVYIPDIDNIFFRVGFFHNFAKNIFPSGTGSLYTEVSYRNHKQANQQEMTEGVIEGLKNLGFIRGKQSVIAQDINDIQYGYPIYDTHYHRARNGIIDFLLKHNIIPCGRYGSWQYMSMEDAILDGKRVADYVKL
jgi:protoporphyrinogen oxidase